MPPGSLIHVGEVHDRQSRISLIDYSKEAAEQRTITSIDEIAAYKEKDTVTWVIVEGLTNTTHIESIGKLFDIHPLVLEDILNTHQRPKFEEYDEHLYIVLKAILPKQKQFSVNYEQISILVFNNFVFTFKEKVDDLLSPLIQRINTGKGRFRSLGTDFLTYAILDIIVDQNFLLVDALAETIDSVEDELLSNPDHNTLSAIQSIKREIIEIRRFISPLRDLFSEIIRSESPLINDKTLIFYRDVLDHTLRITEAIDTHRDILSSLLEIYNSGINNKMNEIMKVLTVFASIFIPLTFITGIYGMNFEHMPELKWHWAYPTLWFAFILIPIVLLFYFRKKKWL